MPDPTNDIDGLLLRLRDPHHSRHHAALTALVAERDALRKRVKELESHNSVSVRLLLAERDGLKQENDELRSRCKAAQDEVLDRVFEMDWLRKRVAELVSKADELAAAIKQRDEMLDYSIALQRAIEHYRRGVAVPPEISANCPHHAQMLNGHFASKEGGGA
jgi:uncharacterized coiled-coil DUF342 family protein